MKIEELKQEIKNVCNIENKYIDFMAFAGNLYIIETDHPKYDPNMSFNVLATMKLKNGKIKTKKVTYEKLRPMFFFPDDFYIVGDFDCVGLEFLCENNINLLNEVLKCL